VPLLQIGPLFVGAAVGMGFTVTVDVYFVLQPEFAVPLVTVKEYVAVAVGVAVGLAAVVDDKFDPLQV